VVAVDRETLKDLLREFTKEELVFLFASVINITVDSARQKEMLLNARKIFDNQE
jgi:hypothetical protein